MNKNKIAITMAMATIIGMGAWFSFPNKPTDSPASKPGIILPQQLPNFSMQDSAGTTRNSSEWSGKILIVNFWATWCPPCQEEMPELVVFQEQYSSKGVQVVGVAVDNPEPVKSFMQINDINFPVVLGQDDAIELGKKMGNRISVLPYTAIFDQTGKTLYAQPGKISFDILEGIIKPHLPNGPYLENNRD